MNNFAKRLKVLRSKRGITQKQLGEATNLSARGIQDYELEQRKPGYDVIIALADYFDVPADYLLGRGLFANWELIEDYMDVILNQIDHDIPAMHIKEIAKQENGDRLLMHILPAFVESFRVEPDPDNPGMERYRLTYYV